MCSLVISIARDFYKFVCHTVFFQKCAFSFFKASPFSQDSEKKKKRKENTVCKLVVCIFLCFLFAFFYIPFYMCTSRFAFQAFLFHRIQKKKMRRRRRMRMGRRTLRRNKRRNKKQTKKQHEE